MPSTDPKFTHRATWPAEPATYARDRTAFADGETIARLYRNDHGPSAGTWSWFMSRGGPQASGRADSLAEALAAVKADYSPKVDHEQI